ncbi:hypothetical protein ABT187_04990 [Streptomyces sp. NPDC001817]|uniref:hypothetical protein n=1 Tax=Streptomyces sp. NPDC001817 TaxID=3154398 RepID=UPI0033326DD8
MPGAGPPDPAAGVRRALLAVLDDAWVSEGVRRGFGYEPAARRGVLLYGADPVRAGRPGAPGPMTHFALRRAARGLAGARRRRAVAMREVLGCAAESARQLGPADPGFLGEV